MEFFVGDIDLNSNQVIDFVMAMVQSKSKYLDTTSISKLFYLLMNMNSAININCSTGNESRKVRS
jgi:hypothetical protein